VLCPRLVGRDEQLFVLEDALLAAHGEESRFVALGGEAGIGKTRLPQIRLRLETGCRDEALELAREIVEHTDVFAVFLDTLAVATEALVAAGLLDEAQAAIEAARARGPEAGSPFLDEAEGRILLARGETEKADRTAARDTTASRDVTASRGPPRDTTASRYATASRGPRVAKTPPPRDTP
jgi:hypothetical protein